MNYEFLIMNYCDRRYQSQVRFQLPAFDGCSMAAVTQIKIWTACTKTARLMFETGCIARGTTQIVRLCTPLFGYCHILCVYAAFTGDAYWVFSFRISGSEAMG